MWETEPIPTDEIEARAAGAVEDFDLNAVPTSGELSTDRLPDRRTDCRAVAGSLGRTNNEANTGSDVERRQSD